MPFFIPSRLIELDYLGGEEDKEFARIAEPYRDDMDFAFFAVNFGYTKKDYEDLTLRDVVFLKKAWEDKMVLETSLINKAVNNAVYNVNRGKRKPAQKLWKKKPRPVDAKQMKALYDEVLAKEKEKGLGWIDKIRRGRKSHE